MGYVFVSHASEDKQQRVKPLVEALAMQGVKLWIDRPGHGDSHFNFDQDFIDRYGVQSLRTGLDFDDQISQALREAGAILVCLSTALRATRQVLVQELLLGKQYEKLVACIVDDLPYSKVPSDLGLADASKIQAERVDPARLRKAVDLMKESPGLASDELPTDLKRQWEIVRKLVKDINRILDRLGPRAPSVGEMAEVRAALYRFPNGPMVKRNEIPHEIIDIFADSFGDPERAKNFVSLAMQIRNQCNPENYKEDQILVKSGEILSPHHVAAEQYWGDVLRIAGWKSRRTLAALLISPGAPSPDKLRAEHDLILTRFVRWLEKLNS